MGFSCAPWLVIMASINGLFGPLTCPDSSRIANIGLKPCAVDPSADKALYVTLSFSPTIVFWLGIIRVTCCNAGCWLIILLANSNTSAAWSLDCAPLTI